YIYDDFDQLLCVIPPEATKRPSTEYFQTSDNTAKDEFLNRWSFRFKYDPWGRMTVRQVPGAEPLLMVYDLDRLVLTQDGNQRLVNEWTFTKYDVLNRPILTGIYSHGSAISQADMQAFLNNYYGSNPSYRFESRGSTVHGYTNQSFPNVSSEV